MNELVKITKENALAIFTSDQLDDFLRRIEEDALNFVPDITTDKGRSLIASNAYIISKKKVEIDNIGKELVADWKRKSKLVDESRKKSRDFLDDLRDRVRQPLTAWETAEAEKKEAARLEKELSDAQEEAIKENEMFDKIKEFERREAEARRKLEEKEAAERAKKWEEERIEREKQLIKNAKEAAEREAAEKIEREKQLRIEAEQREKLREQAFAKEQEEAKRRAIEEERERVKAEEHARLKAEQLQKEKNAAILRDKNHRREVCDNIIIMFVSKGIPKDMAIRVVELIAKNEIINVNINFL